MDYKKRAWSDIVANADLQLSAGTCPLVEDEAILWADQRIQELESNKKNYLGSDSLGTILVFAARYAHTRKTGGALQVVRSILKSWDLLDLKTKEQLVREAKNEATCNHEDWQLIIEKLPSYSTEE